MKYGFIGTGNMTKSILKGMLTSRFAYINEIVLSSRTKTSTDAICNVYKGATGADNNSDLVRQSNIIILAIKPHDLDTVLDEIYKEVNKKLNTDFVIVSIVAGKNIEYLESKLPSKTPIVRVMPNINSKVLHSTSGYCKNNFVSESMEKAVVETFKSIGSMTYIDESNFDVFTSLAGSSIAFTYLYMNTLATAGVKHGLPKEVALDIVNHSIIGCGKMISELNQHPIEIIDEISSPKGITIEGISSLYSSSFQGDIIKSFDAMMKKNSKV